MNARPITSLYLRQRLAAVVLAILLSALAGLWASHATQGAIRAKADVAALLDAAHLQIAQLGLNLRELAAVEDAQRALSRRARLRRNAEEMAPIAAALDRAAFDPATQAVLDERVIDPFGLFKRLCRIAEHVAADASLYGEAASRPVSAGLELAQQILPEIEVLREAERAALARASRRYGRMNTAAFGLTAALLLASVLLVFRPMERRVLDAQSQALEERREAQAASRAKSEFLAVMSHELRTPMNGVIGMADMLLESGLPEAQRQPVEVIARSGHALMDIIDDVLDLSKIEAGRLELDPEALDLAELVEGVAELFRGVAASKGLRLEARIETRPRVVSDPRAIRQVLTNLVGNAVKFTEAGSVTISLRAVREEEGRLGVELAVSDTGIGIAPEARERVFASFEQAERTTTRRFGGTGLGLAITRRLVEALGGRVALESEPGRGSVFTVSLDLERAAAPAAPAEPPPADPAAPSVAPDAVPDVVPDAAAAPAGAEILVADDNAVNVAVLRTMLRSLGFEPAVARDGREAVALAEGRRFDLVIMDVSMPELDGYAATRALRARERSLSLAPTRIVGLSAHAGEAARAEALRAGMDDYLAKPVRMQALRDALGALRIRAPRPETCPET